MKYELVSRSVTIKGKVFRKSEDLVLDDEKFGKVLLESLYKAGFIKPKGSKAKNPAETIDQYHSELGKKEEPKVKEEKKEVKEEKPEVKKEEPKKDTKK